MIILTVLSLPFMIREPIDLPPIVSVELIQISDKTNIPYAPKARKIIEETKKKEKERVVSEQAPPAAKAKEKPDKIPKPDDKKEEKNLETTLLIDPANEEAILMLMEIGIKKTNYSKVKELSERFTKVCKNLCNENEKILQDLKNLEPKNES